MHKVETTLLPEWVNIFSFLLKGKTGQCPYRLNQFMFYDICLVQYESSWLLAALWSSGQSQWRSSLNNQSWCAVFRHLSVCKKNSRRFSEHYCFCNECLGQRLVHPAVCLHGWVQLTKSGRDQGSEIMFYKLAIIYRNIKKRQMRTRWLLKFI